MRDYTVQEIINQAVEVAGNPNLTNATTQSLIWLDEVIDNELLRHNWDHVKMRKQVNLTKNIKTYALPVNDASFTLWGLNTRPRRGNMIDDKQVYYQTVGAQGWNPVFVRTEDEYLARLDWDYAAGPPDFIYARYDPTVAAPNNYAIIVYPIPDASYSLKYAWYPELNTPLTLTTSVSWPNPGYLVQRLVEKIYQHQDDKRLLIQKQVVKEESRQIRDGLDNAAVTSHDLPLNPRFFKTPPQ